MAVVFGFLTSPMEWGVVALLALLFFGNRLPSVMRNLGEGVTEFKKGMKGGDDDEDDEDEEPRPRKSPRKLDDSRAVDEDRKMDEARPLEVARKPEERPVV
jgi:sec-independent protein translocase protein TatA